MPYKIIEGVYIRENSRHNNFPVYRRENDNLLFYYTTSKGVKFLAFGRDLQEYFGVAARVNSAVDPDVWLSAGSLDRNDVFNGLIRSWQYFNNREQTNYYVSVSSSSPMIKAVCVDKDFRECNSDRLYLNENFTDGKGGVLNDLTRDYFARQQGVFRNLRPVFKHSSRQLYLQYVDDYWVVTGAYTPKNYNDKTYMRIKDLALRPEYITKTWSVHYNGWRDEPKLRLLCRGVNHMSNTCASKPCDNKAKCVYTSGNETLCLCTSGYTGVTCSINKQCLTPSPSAGTELNFAYQGKRPGDLGVSFCSGSYPSVRFSLCVDNYGSYSSYWSRRGRACRMATTNPPRKTTTRRPPRTFATRRPWEPQTPRAAPINFDDIPYLVPVVLSGATILQLFLPFVIFFCAKCIKGCKETKEEREDQRRMQEVGGELERRLGQVARAGSQEELDRNVQEYQQAVQEYQEENDDKELSRKRGLYRNASLWRLISMHLYFSFYLWLIYFEACEISQCTQYGRVFNGLRTFAIVIMSSSPVIILIESIFCHELEYLLNIMQDETAWGYIQKMHQVQPKINMVVECYHFETRTRVVYYTDANGNTQSRTETYTEKVVTFVDQDEFSFGSWVDVSKKEMPALSSASVTRVRIDPCVLFGDEETADDYNRQVSAMIDRNRHRDMYTDFSANREIPGLNKRISAYVDLKVKPWWIRARYFWLATLLMMTWPYRWLFRAKTGKSYYILKKKIYKSATPPREVDPMDPFAVLASNASSMITSNATDDNQPAYPMAEMDLGNTAFQDGSPAYPPGNSAAEPPYPAGPHPSAPSLACDAGAPYPQMNPLNAVGPDYPLHPAGSAYPSQATEPSFAPYPVGPQPDAPPPSYEAAVGYTPQPCNEKCSPRS